MGSIPDQPSRVTHAAAVRTAAGVDRALTGFYAVVVLIALAGQTGAAVTWLHWPLLTAVAAVAAVEFGGIVLSAYADHRRRLGEHALSARTLSAAVATGAVTVNWLGHSDHLQGGFFAGMSALGYLVWLLHSGARRRDQLRAAGTLPPTAPVYGLTQWARRPALTRRARAIALADPSLGLYGSLTAARAQARTERRQGAIAALLRRKLAAGRDQLAADIAVTVYDLDEIAARLAAAADYDGLTALLAADLTPHRLAGPVSGRIPDTDPPADPPADQTPKPEPARPIETAVATPTAAPVTLNRTAAQVAKIRRANPTWNQPQVAKRLKMSERTLSRYWQATAPPPQVDTSGNGHHPSPVGAP